jgi:TatA/E family protein of Tat protein translocase
LVIAVLFLILFGPSKLPQMARDLGKFVNEARRSMEEFKSEIVAADEDDEKNVKPKR